MKLRRKNRNLNFRASLGVQIFCYLASRFVEHGHASSNYLRWFAARWSSRRFPANSDLLKITTSYAYVVLFPAAGIFVRSLTRSSSTCSGSKLQKLSSWLFPASHSWFEFRSAEAAQLQQVVDFSTYLRSHATNFPDPVDSSRDPCILIWSSVTRKRDDGFSCSDLQSRSEEEINSMNSRAFQMKKKFFGKFKKKILILERVGK